MCVPRPLKHGRLVESKQVDATREHCQPRRSKTLACVRQSQLPTLVRFPASP